MNIYYLNAEYEPGKHRIITVWSPKSQYPKPDAIVVAHGMLTIDDDWNRDLCSRLPHYRRIDRGTPLPDLFYVNNTGQVCDENGVVQVIAQNPNKADWVASVLAGATDAQIDNWFQNNVTTLAQARNVMAMMAKLIARLARQAGFE